VSDDVVELKVRFRRRSAKITIAVVAVLVLLVTWWTVSGTAAVAMGSAASSGVGHWDQCTYANDDFWALYAQDEAPVAVQTIRNDGRWPVVVVSRRPEAFRFSPPPADFRDDSIFPADPAEGAPPEDETADRVTIPPGRQVSMWIIDPFRRVDGAMVFGQVGNGDRTGAESAPVTVWSLGVPRDVDIALLGTLWQSPLTSDSSDFQDELALLCDE